MNYRPLFIDNDKLQGEGFVCRFFRNGDAVSLSGRGRYAALLVLSGTVTLFVDKAEYIFPSGRMTVVDKRHIDAGFCLPDTIMLEYALPRELAARIMRNRKAFIEPCTPSVPVKGRLEEWVEECLGLNFRRENNHLSEDLVFLLVKYQPRRMGALCDPMKNYLAGKDGQRRNKERIP